ncbi:MAG: hypothetical protein NT018_07665 [Armatimonadetes bacterium]|nr:hypothetical protein [Armatimonadota bacterium]
MNDAATAAMNYSHLLQEAFGESPVESKVSPITLGNSGVSVARVTGKTEDGTAFSVVVKARTNSKAHAALWYAEDPGAADREYRVYELLEELDLPHAAVLAKRYDGPDNWAIVLEDLANRYHLPKADHAFSEADRNSIIHTYSLIHSRTTGIDFGSVRLQHEDGSEVTAEVAEQMLETLGGFDIDGYRLNSAEFYQSVSVLLSYRQELAAEPRCLIYSDFHQTNVALPRNGVGQAILFDWELARVGLPQFDALNAGFADEAGLAMYFEMMQTNGVKINPARFKVGLKYAELSGVFYTLWLLYLKLQKDPGGRLPKWMSSLAMELFNGGLSARASAVSECDTRF